VGFRVPAADPHLKNTKYTTQSTRCKKGQGKSTEHVAIKREIPQECHFAISL